ncbi:hypothetical protein WMF37_21690 [Sorangium sp. So ce291]|uniref:hypothetical protein n=1 Tax=Sorangium sp. So ce291 TaxID=3133294 RepID=UPI003F6173FE
MQIGRLIFAVAFLSGLALCAASCWMPSSEATPETEGTASEPEAAEMALSEADGATSEQGASKMIDGEAVEESTEQSLDAIGLLKIIRCNKSDRGLPCMIQCAEAGISCAAKRPHPRDRNVEAGSLGQCRKEGLFGASSCWYYYPNGQLCVFLLWRSFCRIDND